MNELGRLLSIRLKIPVDRGIDFGTWAEVLYNGQNLGTVQLIQTPANLIIDDSPASINNLRWDYVYLQNQATIDGLIATHFSTLTENLIVSIGQFRNLYVRNLEGIILGVATCAYENGKWRVDVNAT